MEIAGLTILLVVNLVAFAAYGRDKSRAKRNRVRVSEYHLLLLAFLFGLFGAWAGVKFFRHKTRKKSFLAKLIAVSIFNPIWVVAWLCLR